DLRPGVCAARSRQNGYFLCHVERFGSALEAGRRRQNGSGRAADSEVNRSGGTPEGQDVTRYDDDSDTSLGDCCAHGDSEHSRYLFRIADNFAKVRTREEEVFGPSLLKEVGTELGAGYLRGDRQDGNAAALTIMESIDEMEIARPAASCADRKFACNLRFATSREGRDLLVPNHHPVDAIVSADGIGKSVERVTGDSVDTLYSSSQECLYDYIGDLDQHLLSEHLSLDAILRSNGYTIATYLNGRGSTCRRCYGACLRFVLRWVGRHQHPAAD